MTNFGSVFYAPRNAHKNNLMNILKKFFFSFYSLRRLKISIFFHFVSMQHLILSHFKLFWRILLKFFFYIFLFLFKFLSVLKNWKISRTEIKLFNSDDISMKKIIVQFVVIQLMCSKLYFEPENQNKNPKNRKKSHNFPSLKI